MPDDAGAQTRTQILLDVEQIQAVIPHRAPFLLIDRIVELDPGKRCVGEKDVRLSRDDFLRGHFPDYAVMPGVLIVEALAQTGAVLVMYDQGDLVPRAQRQGARAGAGRHDAGVRGGPHLCARQGRL